MINQKSSKNIQKRCQKFPKESWQVLENKIGKKLFILVHKLELREMDYIGVHFNRPFYIFHWLRLA